MAFYPVHCGCGWEGDVWQDMSERKPGAPYPVCPQCGGETTREITRPMVHGADTARAPGQEWSHALSEGDDPVYVKDRGAWKDILRRQGLKPAEDGETEAARKAHMAQNKKDRKNAVGKALDDALHVAWSAGHENLKNELRRNEPARVVEPWMESPVV